MIYIDGKEAGRHTGGCSPFAVDLTKFVKCGSVHNLVVRVEDYGREGLQPLGKQSPWYDSRGCSYTRTTGIWQTVWMEAVHPAAMKNCRIVPDFDNGSFTFSPVFYQEPRNLDLTVSIFDNDKEVVSRKVKANNGLNLTLTLPTPKEWNPATPFLYDVVYTLSDETGIVDEVKSYAGLRKIHIENGCCYLNNKPVYLRFVLDQGFNPESLWTVKDDATIIRDIELSMKAGFNGARLHQKIFDERFHYYADKMGYLTWAEYPDWGMSFWQHFQRTNPNYNLSFRNYLTEWSNIVQRDWNHPSIIAWTPFNETCAICDNDEHKRMISDVYDLTKLLDPTRPVNDTSGYVHAKTDLWTVHTYIQDPEKLSAELNKEPVLMLDPKMELEAWNGQPYILDEYGGVKYLPEGKKPYAANSWGYNKEVLNREATMERIAALTDEILANPKITGYCYTQLTDIEQEENGIYCYDRSEKFDMEVIRKCFSKKPEWSIY
jgi:beta-galactosidase/beta-glucuronidase